MVWLIYTRYVVLARYSGMDKEVIKAIIETNNFLLCHGEEFRIAIRQMKRREKLYKILKEELMIQGYWKGKPRGNPKKGYKNMKERKNG